MKVLEKKIPQHSLLTMCAIIKEFVEISPSELNCAIYGAEQSGIDSLLTVRELREVLKISHKHVYNLRDQGKLNFLYVGKSVRIRESEVIALLERRSA